MNGLYETVVESLEQYGLRTDDLKGALDMYFEEESQSFFNSSLEPLKQLDKRPTGIRYTIPEENLQIIYEEELPETEFRFRKI